MAFQLSPGVLVTEKDLTTIVPAVATSAGGMAGTFAWGPAEEVILIDSENKLKATYHEPDANTYEWWFTAANFLQYGNNLQVVRALASTHTNATAGNGVVSITVTAGGTGYTSAPTVAIAAAPSGGTNATATATVASGAVTAITITNAGAGYTSAPAVTFSGGGGSNAAATAAVTVLIKNRLDYDNNYSTGQGAGAEWTAKYAGALGNSLKVSMCDEAANQTAYDAWAYVADFDGRPGDSTYVSNRGGSKDEVHVIVVDEDGLFTGTAGTVLERFPYLSKAADARKDNGEGNYYVDVINNQSKYIYWTDHTSSGTNWGTAAQGITFAISGVVTESLTGGVDGNAVVTDGNWQTAATKLKEPDEVDIQLFLLGPGRPHSGASAGSTNWVWALSNIAEYRKDCVVFVSPEYSDVVNQAGSEVTNAVALRDTLTSSSYAVLDGNWKYQYDRYNDVFRWLPMNGDTAGLCVRTDTTTDPWFSPAGFNRGQVKNVIKMAYQPTKAQRDTLYKKGINPVVTFAGEGTILFGDKTMLAKPSAFDRINVRRLFLVLEKSIAIAAKYSLFEFNDEFTRAQFKNMVDPFLRDVQSRRGIFDFKVVCDTSNNTPEVIDRNEFIADIYVKPARSINYIFLNFIATRTGVSFEEVGG